MRKILIAVLMLYVLPLMGCRYANISKVWGMPIPCIITTTAAGPPEEAIAYSVGHVADGSYNKKMVDAFIAEKGLTQDPRWLIVQNQNRKIVKWLMEDEHIFDLWFEGWWRGEDDDKWQSIGIDNH